MTGEYVVGDALEHLRELEDEQAALVHLDDAWARPKRDDEYSDDAKFGVNYPTHGLETTHSILNECYRVLKPGGWVIADTDDYLLPRLISYFQTEWGDVAATYRGGGYRRAGSVVLTTKDGRPDRSTPGMYLSNGGYHVVFAHKGETDRRTSESARQIARRPQERYGWAGVKPTSPYETWVEALTEPNETVLEPCAGTAPAAIAAEQSGREWLAIDIEADAREAYRRRRDAELGAESEQQTLSAEV